MKAEFEVKIETNADDRVQINFSQCVRDSSGVRKQVEGLNEFLGEVRLDHEQMILFVAAVKEWEAKGSA